MMKLVDLSENYLLVLTVIRPNYYIWWSKMFHTNICCKNKTAFVTAFLLLAERLMVTLNIAESQHK